uniref:Uncharacterized protein n=1 Tax=Parascaris univalens TaxID=6257 RepID=A0A914ZL11_PARUN
MQFLCLQTSKKHLLNGLTRKLIIKTCGFFASIQLITSNNIFLQVIASIEAQKVQLLGTPSFSAMFEKL